MIELYTDRLYCKTMMKIVDCKLREYCDDIVEISIDNLLKIKPTSGLESCFRFYDKNNVEKEICYIAITDKRGKLEITYETNEVFRKQGYMSEALNMLIKWIFCNTSHSEIWALPTNDISKHLLSKNKFEVSSIYYDSKLQWYVLKKEMENING